MSNFGKFLGKLAAGLIAAERIHSIAKAISPVYSSWSEMLYDDVRRKLGLYKSFWYEVLGFLKLTPGETFDIAIIPFGFMQRGHISHFVYHNVEIDRIYAHKDKKYESIQVVGGPDIDLSNCEQITLKEVTGYTAITPDELLMVRQNPTENRSLPKCLDMYYPIFCRYKGVPIVVQVPHTYDYDKLAVMSNLKDKDIVKEFVLKLEHIALNSNAYQGLASRVVEAILVSSNDSNKRLSLSLSGFDPVPTKVDFQLNMDLSLEIREMKKKKSADLGLFGKELLNFVSRDIPGFIEQMEEFIKEGFDGRRSYLLEGPPGTGKSNLIKHIAAMLPDNFSIILVDKYGIDQLLSLVHYQSMFPALVVIEDIDLLLDDDDRKQSLLNFLDGVFSPKKMLTIMTSNHLSEIADAIKNRPGRVDRVIHVGAGDLEVRKAQLASLTRTMTLPVSLDDLASVTDDMTVAQLRELIRRARIYTKGYSGSVDREALELVLEEFDRKLPQTSKQSRIVNASSFV